jgi:lipopolysaccharide assembly outer membrane protein LptD (OstA)
MIETDALLLQADQADYNEDTAEILAHGDVRVKLK